MSIQFQFNGSQVQFRSDFYNKFQFKENSPSIHCENSIKFFAIESHWHSKFQPCSDVIGLLLSWRMIFPLKRCFVIFVAFGKNVVALINTYSLVQTKYQNTVPLRRDQQLTCNFKFVLRYSNIWNLSESYFIMVSVVRIS